MINNTQGMSFNDPNVYLQMYAQQNNLDIETAKAELQAKYGDPSQEGKNAPEDTLNGNLFASKTSEDDLTEVDSESLSDIYSINLTNTKKEDTEESKSVDKDAVIDALVDKANISYEAAKAALSALGIEDGSEKVDPATKLASFVEATGLTEADAKTFLTTYIGEPKKN